MSVYSKLLEVQSKVSVPKNRTNTFGKYSYRSAEDICEGVKPVLTEVGAAIVLSDKIVNIGDRYYVEATASFIDTQDGASIQNTALARESAEKKGMDDSQISGTASSYARKYALNGLLLLDDNKDADTDENRIEREARSNKKTPDIPKDETISEKEQEVLKSMCEKAGLSVETTFPKGLAMPASQYTAAVTKLQGLIDKKAKK